MVIKNTVVMGPKAQRGVQKFPGVSGPEELRKALDDEQHTQSVSRLVQLDW